MKRQLKLIWDFRGPAALKTAEHHEKHLKEYIASQGISTTITGVTEINAMSSIAFMVVEETEMPAIRDVLRPHRGEIYAP